MWQMLPPRPDTWLQTEPVAVVAYGLGKTYAEAPMHFQGIPLHDPGDIHLYFARMNLPQDCVSIHVCCILNTNTPAQAHRT